MIRASHHFVKRVRERLPGVDPELLIDAIRHCIEVGDRESLRYVGRLKRPHETIRVFEFDLPTKPARARIILADKPGHMILKTILICEE